MLFIILNSETQEELDRFETEVEQFFEGIKQVEQNKEKYLKAGCPEVKIVQESDSSFTHWKLIEGEMNTIVGESVYFVDMKKSNNKMGRASQKQIKTV